LLNSARFSGLGATKVLHEVACSTEIWLSVGSQFKRWPVVSHFRPNWSFEPSILSGKRFLWFIGEWPQCRFVTHDSGDRCHV